MEKTLMLEGSTAETVFTDSQEGMGSCPSRWLGAVESTESLSM